MKDDQNEPKFVNVTQTKPHFQNIVSNHIAWKRSQKGRQKCLE